MYYYLLPPKGWSWLIIRTKAKLLAVRYHRLQAAWDEVKRRRHWASNIAACLKETLSPNLIFSIIRKNLYLAFRIIEVFQSRTTKMDIVFKILNFVYQSTLHWYNFFVKLSFWKMVNLFTVTVGNCLTIGTIYLIFRDIENFLDGRDIYYFFFDVQNLNPVSIFVDRRQKLLVIQKF